MAFRLIHQLLASAVIKSGQCSVTLMIGKNQPHT